MNCSWRNPAFSVVHCPEVPLLLRACALSPQGIAEGARGVNICLGTDSLASNNALDMRSEMREARQVHSN